MGTQHYRYVANCLCFAVVVWDLATGMYGRSFAAFLILLSLIHYKRDGD